MHKTIADPMTPEHLKLGMLFPPQLNILAVEVPTAARVAQYLYDPASATLKPYGSDSSLGKIVCYQCHTRVAATDFILPLTPAGS